MDAHPPTAASPRDFWPPTLAALAAMFVGIGLARFAYTPLLPAIISAGWFLPDQAAYLGAANLAGYLAGAVIGHRLTRIVSTPAAARGLMALTAVSFFCCAEPASFAWFSLWRFVSGLTGGALMVIAAPSALALVPARRRGLASGLIFTGVGLGIAASGTLTPVLLSFGLAETWLAYGLITTAATLAVWRCWPAGQPVAASRAAASGHRTRWPLQASAIVAAYGLVAAGLVPHMVFLVDYVARGLGAGIGAGAAYWVLFGLGATAGPTVAGLVADRTGFAFALNAAIALQVAAVGPGRLQRQQVLWLLDHGDDGRIAARIGADLAQFRLGDVEAPLARADLGLHIPYRVGQGHRLGISGLEDVEGQPLGGPRADAGQAAKLGHQAFDCVRVTGHR